MDVGTPRNRQLFSSSSSSALATPPTATKRSLLAAQIEQDPDLSSARRMQKSQAFESRMAKTSLERRLLAAEDAKRELESLVKEKEITIDRLEGDRRWLAEREQEARDEKERSEADWAQEKSTLDRNLRTVRSNFISLQATHADLEDEYATLQRTTSSAIASQKSSLSLLERKCSLLDEERDQLRALAQERAATIKELRDRLDEAEAEAGNTSRANAGDENWAVVRDELHRQTAYVRTLEQTNSRLNSELATYKARQQSVEVLKEEKRDLERKLRKAEEVRDRVVQLEGEVDAAKKEREEWAAFLNNPNAEPTFSTPTAITQTLSKLRLNYASLLEEHGSVSSSLALRTAELEDLSSRAAETFDRCTKLEVQLRREEDKATRRERRAALAEREVSSLKALLATYTAEEEAFTSRDGDGLDYDAQKSQRIEQLEGTVEELKIALNELEGLLEKAEKMGGGGGNRVDEEEVKMLIQAERESKAALAEELAQATAACSEQEAKIEALEQQLWELGVKIGAGNHVPRNIRVLQLQQNPAQEHFELRRDELERLKAENHKLLGRIGELESRGGGGSAGSSGGSEPMGWVPRESWDNLNQEKDALVDTVAQKEKRLLRLKQVFQAKAVEFREAVSSILGYKLAFQSTKVRLTSMYDLTASIVFDSSSGAGDVGTMKLVGVGNGGAGGPPQLEELMQFWVFQRQSIPCFLAALTLECYERTTMGRTAGWHQTLSEGGGGSGSGGDGSNPADSSAMDMTRTHS
ncbi:hypothetical protein BOTBODRAFT_26885 [Botryobasidium botryosum FD-172 SS1]|uniref:Spindle assembly checkpoint component MAD1 n=1 Tax=Botryobasidium botryosum (strain FD-172 SS1) TaxID=930990 RepID=A0A067MYR3_BOTB1|nr:hypothetical protein BOTBODRAFT_26885 [Botryobasidium botryosum FD-172 SS1]